MDDELEKLRAENAQLLANLTSTQERCTVLVLENRELRKRNSRMKLRWVQLLQEQGWEQGPDNDSLVFDYNLDHDHKTRTTIIERDVSKPARRCVEVGHSYGHGEHCYYCGHTDGEPTNKSPRTEAP